MAHLPYAIWRRKLRRIYDEQLRDLIRNRHIFEQANEVWQPYVGRHDGAELSEWMVQTYLAFAVTAIRRITEPTSVRPQKKRKTLSLVILLEDLANNHEMLSRRWYVDMYPARLMQKGIANRDFTQLAGSSSACFMPRHRIRRDIAALRRAAQPLKRFADKVIAHTEEDRRRRGRPSWGHINVAVDLLLDIYKRYHLLLNATSFDPADITTSIHVASDLERIWPA